MMELGVSKETAAAVVLSYHPFVDSELRERLWPLKLSYGDFQYVLKESSIYNTLRAVVAYGPKGGIHGWAGIYTKCGINYVGVFVEEPYRHYGIGGKLKAKALEICKELGITCRWQDRKDNDSWVDVTPDGVVTRIPYR